MINVKLNIKTNFGFELVDIDKDSMIAKKYSVYATPTFIIVDKDGKKVDKLEGKVSETKFRQFIEKWSNK